MKTKKIYLKKNKCGKRFGYNNIQRPKINGSTKSSCLEREYKTRNVKKNIQVQRSRHVEKIIHVIRPATTRIRNPCLESLQERRY